MITVQLKQGRHLFLCREVHRTRLPKRALRACNVQVTRRLIQLLVLLLVAVATSLRAVVDSAEHRHSNAFLQWWFLSCLENSSESIKLIRHPFIRVVAYVSAWRFQSADLAAAIGERQHLAGVSGPVSYTHLTLPTIYSV